jgi:para-aminobenzoate synthetase/4-amino-4-deoxychorismate lyase
VALARAPVRREDRWLFHKTTRRAVYDARRAERPDAFDVLLANEEGELTELTIGNLVAEIGGERLTPPRECGLLAGTFREELLARGEVREAVLRREDLARARRLWLVNAVREWVPIEVVA